MHTHTISVNGRSYNVATPTHVDDHPSIQDWMQKSFAYIQAAANIPSIAGVILTHKPRR